MGKSDIEILCEMFKVDEDKARKMIERGFRVDMIRDGGMEKAISESIGLESRLENVKDSLEQVLADCKQGVQ